MYTFKVQTGSTTRTFGANTSYFQVTSIKGINPPGVQLNFTKIAGNNISEYNSEWFNDRNLVVMGKVIGDLDASRAQLVAAFPQGSKITIFYQNTQKDVKIDGYVEKVDYDSFTNKQMFQVSILCPYPFFKDREQRTATVTAFGQSQRVKFANVLTDADSGYTMSIRILSAVESITVKNANSTNTLIITDSFQANDIVFISAYRGNRKVTLTRSGNTTDIMKKTNFTFPLMPAIEDKDLFVELTTAQATVYGYSYIEYLGL